MARACREFRPELAERVGRAFDGWWERNSRVADAVHALHFGVSGPEQTARQQAFEVLEERLLTDAEQARATDPEAFAERCRRFVDRLEGMARPDHPEPLSAHDMMG